jgi:hypothetical protein
MTTRARLRVPLRVTLLIGALLLAAGAPGCSKNSGGGGNQNNQNGNLPPCPEGTEAHGEACVPLWDDCEAPDEVPVLGGGCLPVGVERCGLGQGCAEGFSGDGTGACTPIRPATPCSGGELGLLGNVSCEAIRECGTAPWGNVTPVAGAVHVDANYQGGASTGSAAAPFTTVGAALAAAPDGGQVVVAAGTYSESVNLDRRVILSGRCPSMVTIQGITQGQQASPPVVVSAGASGSTLEGIRLTGPGHGLLLNEAVDVRLVEVEVLDPAGYGILLQRGATASLRRVRVSGAHTAGVILYGGRVQAVDSEVLGTEPSPDGSFGRGLDLGCDHFGGGGCATLDATGLVLERNHEAGLFLSGGTATLVGSLVADTQPNAIHGQSGIGLQSQCDNTSADCPKITLQGCVVTGNHAAGIMALGTLLTVRDTVVSGTLPQQGDSRLGMGIVAQCDPSLTRCQPLELTCGVVGGNRQAALALAGVEAVVERTILRDTQAQASNSRGGNGLVAQCEPVSGACAVLSLRDSALRRNTFSGIFLHGAEARLEGVLVAATRPGAEDQSEGTAVYAQCDNTVGACADLEVDASLFLDHHAEGMTIFGSSARLFRSSVLSVLPQVSDGELGFGLYVDGTSDVASLDASACEMGDASLSGIFWVSASGGLARSWIHGGDYTAILDDSPDVLLEHNVLEGELMSEPLVQ